MKSISTMSDESRDGRPKLGFLDRLAKRAVVHSLSALQRGSLTLLVGHERYEFGVSGAQPSATVRVVDPRFFADVAFGGVTGGGETYTRGYWESDCVTSVVRIFAANREVLERMDTGFARVTKPLRRLLHRLNQNSRRGSRRNISAHYDLGNDFFALWLDSRMQYSAGIFEQPDASLDDAQFAKLERICGKLDLQPTDHLLEIGTGWGGLAVHAAKHYGCRVTTTTISDEQYEYARRRVTNEGLDEQIRLLKQDYRDLSGTYDKLVSVEMLEAVGHEYHAAFFDKCCALLKPEGLMVLQTITIADQRYEGAKRSVDFVQRYIFPGGCLPSLRSMTESLCKHTDLRITHLEDIGPHYATTLRHWHDRLFVRLDEVRQLGYSNEFLRMWKYYLCYCEGGFLERAIGNVQFIAVRPRNRQAVYLPR